MRGDHGRPGHVSEPSDYDGGSPAPPAAIPYVCKCGANGCKLWRECNIAFSDLYCAPCALANQGEAGVVDSRGRLDGSHEIGWLVPAVPITGALGFHGYGSIPTDRADWWRSLPSYPDK